MQNNFNNPILEKKTEQKVYVVPNQNIPSTSSTLQSGLLSSNLPTSTFGTYQTGLQSNLTSTQPTFLPSSNLQGSSISSQYPQNFSFSGSSTSSQQSNLSNLSDLSNLSSGSQFSGIGQGTVSHENTLKPSNFDESVFVPQGSSISSEGSFQQSNWQGQQSNWKGQQSDWKGQQQFGGQGSVSYEHTYRPSELKEEGFLPAERFRGLTEKSEEEIKSSYVSPYSFSSGSRSLESNIPTPPPLPTEQDLKRTAILAKEQAKSTFERITDSLEYGVHAVEHGAEVLYEKTREGLQRIGNYVQPIAENLKEKLHYGKEAVKRTAENVVQAAENTAASVTTPVQESTIKQPEVQIQEGVSKIQEGIAQMQLGQQQRVIQTVNNLAAQPTLIQPVLQQPPLLQSNITQPSVGLTSGLQPMTVIMTEKTKLQDNTGSGLSEKKFEKSFDKI